MKELKVGIIGIGNIGSAHLHCIHDGDVEGMQVIAVCDINEKKLEYVKEQYPNVQLYGDYEVLLREAAIDAVIISVPHPLHAKIAIRAFECDKHVLLEKPADILVSAVHKLNAVAKESGKTFGIMFNQRTNALFRRAKELVQNGELGELKSSIWMITNWYRSQSYYDSGGWRATWVGEGGGVLINQAPHNLDLWQWICGMPETVTAFCDVAKYHDIEVEDEVTIYTKYHNGATGVFITSTGTYPGTNRLEINGTLGKLVIEQGVLKFWKLKENEREICFRSDEMVPEIEMDYSEYRENSQMAHKKILQNFTNAILKEEELIAPGCEGINELMISNAAYLSEWQGNTKISLPFNEQEFDCLLKEKMKASKFYEMSDEKMSTEYKFRWQVQW